MMSGLIGIVLGFLIGVGCRWFDLPLPAPPRVVGALLVVAMTLGFLGAEWFIGAYESGYLAGSAQR
jgi:XapX domain-containing protein